jgi:hypothetical protein
LGDLNQALITDLIPNLDSWIHGRISGRTAENQTPCIVGRFVGVANDFEGEPKISRKAAKTQRYRRGKSAFVYLNALAGNHSGVASPWARHEM